LKFFGLSKKKWLDGSALPGGGGLGKDPRRGGPDGRLYRGSYWLF